MEWLILQLKNVAKKIVLNILVLIMQIKRINYNAQTINYMEWLILHVKNVAKRIVFNSLVLIK